MGVGLASEGVGGAPVAWHGRIVGMVSGRDLLDFIAALPADPAAVDGGVEHGILDDHTVEEAMTLEPLRTVTADDPVSRAAELMDAERIHRLRVVVGQELVGMVSTLGLVKALADRRVGYRTYLFPKRSHSV